MSAAVRLVYGLAIIDADATKRALRAITVQAESDDLAAAVLLGYLHRQNFNRLRFANAAHMAAACMVRLALVATPLDRWLPHLLAFVDGMDTQLDAALYRVGHAGAWGSHVAAVRHIGTSTLNEQVALALYHLIRYPDDYTAAVTAARSSAYETTLLTSALSAARLGMDAIPHEWIATLPDRAALDALIAEMNFNSEG